MLTYPITLTSDTNGTFLVQFPDIPEAITVADDETEALVNGEEALEAAIEIYFDEKRIVPAPSKVKREQRKAELARRLNVHMPQVDRLVDLRHSSKLENIEAAFHTLGKNLEISVA
ncbi:MAG: type II toxin-antitoxin system HicB family antitoxin [Burkholderiaceae bacterium]